MNREFAVFGTSSIEGKNASKVVEGAKTQLRTILGRGSWVSLLTLGIGLVALDVAVKNPEDFEGGDILLPSLYDKTEGKFNDARDDSRSRIVNHEISSFSRNTMGDLDYFHKVIGEVFSIDKFQKRVKSAPRTQLQDLASRPALVALVFVPKMEEVTKHIVYGDPGWADPRAVGISHRDTAVLWQESTARSKYLINLSRV